MTTQEREGRLNGMPFRADATGIVHATYAPLGDWPHHLTECGFNCVAFDGAPRHPIPYYESITGSYVEEPITCLVCMVQRP